MKIVCISMIGILLAAPAMAQSDNARGLGEDGTSLGGLTKDAIHELDFDQGAHASDPTGDGHGPGTADEPREGLANVIGDGDLGATVDFLNSLGQ